MSLKSKKFFLYVPVIFLNMIFLFGFALVYIYTMNTKENIYQNILKDNEFYQSFLYSLQITFLSISISLVLFFVLFYLLLKLKLKYSKDVKSWLFFLQIPILIPYSLCAFLFFFHGGTECSLYGTCESAKTKKTHCRRYRPRLSWIQLTHSLALNTTVLQTS